jgi:hypothetical protein
MVIWTLGESPPEDPPYERLILRRITFFREESPIFSVENLVEERSENFYGLENLEGESGHEVLKEMLWELFTERSP